MKKTEESVAHKKIFANKDWSYNWLVLYFLSLRIFFTIEFLKGHSKIFVKITNPSAGTDKNIPKGQNAYINTMPYKPSLWGAKKELYN